MDFIRSFCELRHGDFADKGMFYLMVLCLAGLISIPFFIYQDNLEMKAQHCVMTSQSRESTYIQFIYGDKGQIISAYPVTTTEHLWTCDDHPRWR